MSTPATAGNWPADIIHVNEDGWVLVNRGRNHGVTPGLRLLVVGQGIRELRDLFAEGAVDEQAPVLRIRRTYELLDVIHVEAACAIAVAARTPMERRPQIYRGPEGELLVWVPLPSAFTWPLPGETPSPASDTSDVDTDSDERAAARGAEGFAADDTTSKEDAENAENTEDAPPERSEQDDERWEEALPLNGVSVGDRVLPAIPVAGAAGTTSAIASGNPFETGRAYDWMQPEQA